ncbi:hypothetical protein [Gordonia sp. (in: high G+C Gram-positive bacteria)]|uniref:hypothetical protein n=1 Tax=Gordonia sp. (in: high G+C Gram-positive bacteria) TaxID=84139 RepID=UPI003C74E809
MSEANLRYTMNMDWIWGPDNPGLRKKASLAMMLRGADPAQLDALLNDWLASLSREEGSNVFSGGGCSVELLAAGDGGADMVFSSGGQDVAESLGYVVDCFYEKVLVSLDTAEVTWTELPLEG